MQITFTGVSFFACAGWVSCGSSAAPGLSGWGWAGFFLSLKRLFLVSFIVAYVHTKIEPYFYLLFLDSTTQPPDLLARGHGAGPGLCSEVINHYRLVCSALLHAGSAGDLDPGAALAFALQLGCTLQSSESQLQCSKHQLAKHQRFTHQLWVVEVQSTLALPKALQINGFIDQQKKLWAKWHAEQSDSLELHPRVPSRP